MGKAFGFPEGQGVLPSLPIADMCTGVVVALSVASMLRDRAKYGGSYTGTAALTAFQTFTLTKEIGLYQPEIVEKIQQKYNFKPITSDLHVIELYYDIYEAWKKAGLVDDEQYFTHFYDSVYGKDLRVLRPLAQYSDEKTTPRWTSPPVPFCYHKDVAW